MAKYVQNSEICNYDSQQPNMLIKAATSNQISPFKPQLIPP